MPDTPKPTVAVGGLGAIGYQVAEWLDRDESGLELAAVSARDLERARSRTEHFRRAPAVVRPEELSRWQIVVEAAPASAFESIVIPALERGVPSWSRRLARCWLVHSCWRGRVKPAHR